MNESVCSGLCVQLKGSIKECFRGSSVLGRKFGSWCVEESARRWTKKDRQTRRYLYPPPTLVYMKTTHCFASFSHEQVHRVTCDNSNQNSKCFNKDSTSWQAVIKTRAARPTFRAKYQVKSHNCTSEIATSPQATLLARN